MCVVWDGMLWVNITDNNTTAGDFVLGGPGLWQFAKILDAIGAHTGFNIFHFVVFLT